MTSYLETTLRDSTWVVDAEETTASFAVRELGLITVRGGLRVDSGSVTIAGGEPVAATATLDAASVRTGRARRDADLAGRHFFDAARHPRIQVRTTAIEAAEDGWAAATVLTVAGGEAPLDLRVRRRPAAAPDILRITVTGVLDRAPTPIRAPRWLISRWVAITVDATLRLGG